MSLPMTSIECVRALVDKTEANLKVIEQMGGDFVFPVLNEWRYATRHLVSVLPGGELGEDDARKAINHMKRAYFDSCDILIDCQLYAISQVCEKCRGYAEVVSKVIPEYSSWRESIRRAARLHREAQSIHGDERIAACDSLAPSIGELDGMLDKLTFHADEIVSAVRRAKANFWLSVIAKAAGIVVAAIAVVKFARGVVAYFGA